MKNRIEILMLALIFAGLANLQAKDDDGPEKIGIRAGYQSSNLYDDGSKLSGTSNLGAFYAGLYRDNKLLPVLHLGTGLEYMQAGSKSDDDNKLVLHYLSVPVYLKAKIGPIYALGGAAANIKVSEKVFVNGEKMDPPSDEKAKSFDFPLYLGAGFKFLVFSVEARYHWGMLDVDENLRNRYLQIGATLSF